MTSLPIRPVPTDRTPPPPRPAALPFGRSAIRLIIKGRVSNTTRGSDPVAGLAERAATIRSEMGGRAKIERFDLKDFRATGFMETNNA